MNSRENGISASTIKEAKTWPFTLCCDSRLRGSWQRDRDARAHGRFQRMVKRRYNIKLTAKPRMVPKRLCAVHKQPLRSAGWTLRAHTGVSKFVREFRRFFPATYGPAGSIRQSYICSCDVASPRAAARAKYLQMSHKQKTGVQSLTRTGVACPEQANLCQR